MKPLFRTVALALALSTSPLLAENLFEATAITTDALPTLTLTTGSSNFIDFTKNLLDSKGPFQAFNGRAYNASLRYLGVANAIRYSTNTGNTTVSVTFTPTGVTKTFVDTPQKDATTQFEDYFKGEGASVVGDFLKAMSEQSPVSLSDGNPNAATASAAGNLMITQGFTAVEEMDGLDAQAAQPGARAQPRFNGFAIGFNSSKFKAGPFEGTNNEFSYGKTLFTRVSVSGNLSFLDIEGAKVYGLGINVAVPYRVSQMSKDKQLSWRITPLAGLSLRGSEDMANVAPIWQVGVVNSVDYRIGPKLVICAVNQITMHKSFSLNYQDISIDPEIDQLIMKNGVRFVTPLNRRLIADGYLVDTRFLKDAMVKSFESIGGSLSLRATQSMNLTLGANYDTGSDYSAYSVGLSSAWKW